MEKIISAQRIYFESGATLPFEARRKALVDLRDSLKKYEAEICEALKADLGKSAHESYMTEIGIALSDIAHTLKHLRKWMRPSRRCTSIGNFPAKSYILYEPYGVTLIMAPWNYPVLLVLSPLVGALAAGNCCVVKPSELAPATAEVLTKMIADTFDERLVTVVNGGVEESQALLEQKFDYIFYTGSTGVGKYVMEKAAKHLTPVTLELGGKSPVIITKSAHLQLAARRIVFGKFLNAGQTCIAPDYILVEEAVHDAFVSALKEELVRMYGKEPLKNPDYGKIINRRHFDRISRLIDNEKVVFGGTIVPETLQIEPTILDGVSPEDSVMQEEIFGPVLPVLRIKDESEAFRFIQQRPHPLALYLFTSDRKIENHFMNGLQFGGGCVNDVISQIATNNMPFGGVGDSGMGAYHGRHSFLTFSHEKTVIKRSLWFDPPFRYLPYSSWKTKLIKKLL